MSTYEMKALFRKGYSWDEIYVLARPHWEHLSSFWQRAVERMKAELLEEDTAKFNMEFNTVHA